MSSVLHQFLNQEVEVRFPLYADTTEGDKEGDKKGKDVGKVYYGVLSQITDREVFIVAPYNNDFTERDGNSIKVRIMRENKVILKFTSMTIKNYILDDEKNQVFVVKYPTKVIHSTQRSKPRVNTKIPSLIHVYSLKGKVYPLHLRKKAYKSFILDISESGAQVATNKKFPEGLRITLSFAFTKESELKLDGDMVWQKHDRGLYRYGVRFVKPTTDEKYQLRHIVTTSERVG